MTQRLPSVLSPVDLPIAELLAARLDGELFRVGDGFSPVDEVEQPRHRARALRAGISDRLIAEQRSAAWIWGALPAAPNPHQFCVALDARVTHSSVAWVTVRDVVIEASECVVLDELPVTTPLRTAVDLARFSSTFDEVEVQAVVRLMRFGSFGLEECLEHMSRRRNLPNKREAARRLRRCWLIALPAADRP